MTTSMSINKLARTRVLLFGGTSGIGFIVARLALEHGASVILASSQPDKVNEALRRLHELYPGEEYVHRIAGHPCNLGNEATLEAGIIQLFEYATSSSPFPKSSPTEAFVPLDHIVFTAGDRLSIHPINSPEITVPYLHAAGTVRFTGSVMVSKHASTYMRKAPSSSITFTSGANTTRPSFGWGIVAAFGAAVEGLARGMAVDLAPIRVNTVSPGAVVTEMWGISEKGESEARREKYRKSTLIGELGRPEDVAEAYLYLMKDRFVTGELVSSNGGTFLQG